MEKINNKYMKNEQENMNNIDRIPLKERSLFQSFIVHKMGAEHGKNNMPDNWHEVAGLISNVIDDASSEDHEIIKNLIFEGDYEAASKYVLKALESKQKNIIYH